MKKRKKGLIVDSLAILLSGVCVVHCMALPLLIVLLPVLGNVFCDERFHVGMLCLLLPLASYSLFSGYGKHKKSSPLCLGLPGAALIAVGAFSSTLFRSEAYETWITIAGSILLISAHYVNLRTALQHRKCHQPTAT